MSDYHRVTRECSVSQLQPELRQAVQNHFQKYDLGDPETATLLCCETVSTRKNGGLFSLLDGGEDAPIYTGMLLTPEWLIWVRKGGNSEAVLNAANLHLIQVKTYLSLFNTDNGLEITGFVRDAKRPVRGYVGLGMEPAAQKFCGEVEKAVASVQPPPAEKGFARWWRGS